MRYQRQIGAWLKVMPKHPAGRPSDNPSRNGRDLPTLADLNISYKESSRWQKQASIPDDARCADGVATRQSVSSRGTADGEGRTRVAMDGAEDRAMQPSVKQPSNRCATI